MKNKLSKILVSCLACGALLLVSGNAHASQTNNRNIASNHQIVTRAVNVHAFRYNITKVNRNNVIRKNKSTQYHQPVRSFNYQGINSKNVRSDAHFRNVYRVAKSKLGHPYVWGAAGPYYFDCSGFTQYIYQHGAHKRLPRVVSAQMAQCKYVKQGYERPGDLAFFGYGNYASHVGMYVGHGNMIDAQLRGVVIEPVHAPWWHLIGYGRP